jgi:hypothetical protein
LPPKHHQTAPAAENARDETTESGRILFGRRQHGKSR